MDARPPWHLDRAPLVAADVRAILARRFPALRDAPVRSLGHGWDFDAWLVDQRWVFRFPRRQDRVAWQAREVSLLSSLAGRLPLRTPVPTWHGEADDDFPYPFAGHAVVPGRGGDRLLPATACLPRLARDLGAFFAALQAIPPGDVRGPELPRHAASLRHLADEAAQYAPELEAGLPAAAWATAQRYLAGEHDVAAPPAEDEVLVHADLFLEHLIFEPSRGRLTGIIDWADAGWGAPTDDLVPFGVMFGDTFLDELLRSCGRPWPPGTRAYLGVRGTLSLLRWVGEAQRFGWAAGSLCAWAAQVYFPRLHAR